VFKVTNVVKMEILRDYILQLLNASKKNDLERNTASGYPRAEEVRILPLPEIEFLLLGRSAFSLVTIPTELKQFT
jgi:hypothetical protein